MWELITHHIIMFVLRLIVLFLSSPLKFFDVLLRYFARINFREWPLEIAKVSSIKICITSGLLDSNLLRGSPTAYQ